MKVFIDFGGFYDSIHMDNIDGRIEMFLEFGEGIDEDGGDKVDYNQTFKSYGQAWLDKFNNYFDLNVDFIAIDSPRYYNYRTDKIECNFKTADYTKVWQVAISDEFKQWCQDNSIFNGFDGYIPFYESLDDLLIKSKNNDDSKSCLISTVFDYWIETEDFNDDGYDLEFEVHYLDSIGV